MPASTFGRPDLDHPEQRAEVLVDPVLGAADDVLRVVLEVVPDADRRVAGELRADLAEALDRPQVLRDHVVVALGPHRPQDHAAVGVIADRRADVLVRDDEVDHRLDLGLAGRIVAGADLLVLLAPARGEVAVEVEAFEVGVDLDRQAVVVPGSAPRASAGSTRRRTRPARARPSGAGPARTSSRCRADRRCA